MSKKKISISMLEYCKVVLEKISFSPRLFRKEYRKTFRYLAPQDHNELKMWIRDKLKNGMVTS